MAQGAYNYSYIFKFILIGDMGVGKSCILHQFTEKKFLADSAHTIGVEFATNVVDIKDEKVKLQIWDTAGQERFRSVTRSYYRNAVGVLIVYDATSRSSFNHVPTWLSDARSLTPPNTKIILLGNKADLESDRDVSFEEGEKFANENGLLFHETSAKTGILVNESFILLSHQVYEGILDGSIPTDMQMKVSASSRNVPTQQVNLGANTSTEGSFGRCCNF